MLHASRRLVVGGLAAVAAFVILLERTELRAKLASACLAGGLVSENARRDVCFRIQMNDAVPSFLSVNNKQANKRFCHTERRDASC